MALFQVPKSFCVPFFSICFRPPFFSVITATNLSNNVTLVIVKDKLVETLSLIAAIIEWITGKIFHDGKHCIWRQKASIIAVFFASHTYKMVLVPKFSFISRVPHYLTHYRKNKNQVTWISATHTLLPFCKISIILFCSALSKTFTSVLGIMLRFSLNFTAFVNVTRHNDAIFDFLLLIIELYFAWITSPIINCYFISELFGKGNLFIHNFQTLNPNLNDSI